MTPGKKLADLSLEGFSERLAQHTPTPGGGSVAAYLVAIGAGLAIMAFRFTTGEKFAVVEGEMEKRAEELERLRSHALELVDRDSLAYDAVTAAYRLPKSTDAEKSARAEAVQAALRGALGAPLETLGAARAALQIAAQGASDINPNLASDCATASWCLWSAAEAAALNVRINAASLQDREYARAQLVECERMRLESMALAESTRSAAARRLS
jgi:formiminotetrahydrofolate cyclodeaminase